MAYRRVHKSSPSSFPGKQEVSQLAPRPFAIRERQGPNAPPSREELENDQNQNGASGLQLAHSFANVQVLPPGRPVSVPVVQRTLLFGDRWASNIKKEDWPGDLQQHFDQGNEAAIKELEVKALRGSGIPNIVALMEYPGSQCSVVIDQGIHSDGTGGRELRLHQTVKINVNGTKWTYHVMYKVSGSSWAHESTEQMTNRLNAPAVPDEEPNLYPEGALFLQDAYLATGIGGINSGAFENAGPVTFTVTANTYKQCTEINIVRCPRYVGMEGARAWVKTSKIPG